MIDDLGSGGFSYLGSATLPENFDGLLPPAHHDLVKQQADRALAELCRDLLVNKGFRRDVYAKGRDPIWRREMELTIDRLQVISLVSMEHLSDESFVFKTTMGDIKGRPEHFRALLQEMEAGPISIGELRHRLHPTSGADATEESNRAIQAHLLQNLALCLQARLVGLVPTQQPDSGPAQRFNRVITEVTSAGAPYQEGTVLEGETLRARLEELVVQVLERRLPLLRRLGGWA